MSIAGYLSPGGGAPRLSQQTAAQISAEFHGPVLRGNLTSAERLVEEAIAAAMPNAERYLDVRDYDPVLRAHCRLS